VTFTPRGEAQNSVCLVDPSGAVRRCRAKRDLVPVGERRFLGLLAGDGFRPGDATPYFRAPGRSLVPLVCLEGTHPWTARRGVEAGGALAVVVASDRPIAGNRVAQTQALASTVVMSAALRVPMLRATREGRSVLALPDGRYRLGPARRTAAVSW
jgi:apolipoprotein N-acyltransferase